MDFFAQIVAPAAAQELRPLHVRAFVLSAEPATVRVGEPLRLRILARVDERLTAMDNVVLPDLSGFTPRGDERQCAATARGSECLETMTLEATVPGDRTIAPATLEAIDARSGKPSRFATNTVTVHVLPAPPNRSNFMKKLVTTVALVLAALALVLAVLIVALLAIARQAPSRNEPQKPSPPEPPKNARDPLLDIVLDLRRSPTRANALNARDLLRSRAAAREHETCDDLCVRRRLEGTALGGALRAIEIPAFAPDGHVEEAIAGALPSLERLAGEHRA